MSNNKSIYRSDNSFLLTIELPGVKKEDLQVQVKDSILHVKAERKRPEARALHLESNKQFYRADFPLSTKIDGENIEARLENGVLYIELQKNEKTHTIPIRGKT